MGAGITGTGSAFFEADVSPGFSPASVSFSGNVTLNSTANLKMELGGTTVGTQYDKVAVGQQLSLAGTLQVVLINGFSPALGNSFDILDWNSRSGTFSSLQLPALSGSLIWNTSQLYSTGAISVIDGNFLPGDVNRDGLVDVADISAMEGSLKDLSAYKATHLFGGLPMTDPQLAQIADLSGDDKVTNIDIQGLIVLLANGGGSGGASVSVVPEPNGAALAALAIFAVIAVRLPRRSF
jgi:hypothetical protein